MTPLHLYHTTGYTSVPYSASPLQSISYSSIPCALYLTLTSLLKTLQVSTVTARDHILPYFTFTEQKYYPTILSIPLLNRISLNYTSPDHTEPLHCLFQLTITLQYHKLLFSTITKLLTLNNHSTHLRSCTQPLPYKTGLCSAITTVHYVLLLHYNTLTILLDAPCPILYLTNTLSHPTFINLTTPVTLR